jgi:hypothetical protein
MFKAIDFKEWQTLLDRLEGEFHPEVPLTVSEIAKLPGGQPTELYIESKFYAGKAAPSPLKSEPALNTCIPSSK